MTKAGYFKIAVAWLAVAGMCIPQIAFAATPSRVIPAIGDVALRDGGLLVGQVVKADGTPVLRAAVSLRSGDKELAAGTTSVGGYFAFSGLRPGTYQVATANGAATYQVWAADAAPPTAQPGALVVAGGDVVRGQEDGSCCCPGGLFAHPLLLGGLIAAAIAIPIAVSNSHRHHGSND